MCLSACVAGMLACVAPAANGATRYADDDLPLPMLVLQSDLIVAATVLEAGEEGEHTLPLPDLDLTGWASTNTTSVTAPMRRYRARVDQVWHAAPPIATGAVIDVWGRVEDGSAPASPTPPSAWVTPQPRVGTAYVFLLRSMEEAAGYYLPAYMRCATPLADAAASLGRAYEATLHPDTWGWGPTNASGLQLCVRVRDPATHPAGLDVIVGLRNRSGDTIPLTAHGGLRPLQFRLTTARGAAVEADLNPYRTDLPDPRSLPLFLLPPGHTVLLSESGVAAFWAHLPAQLKPGEYVLHATYVVPTLEDPELARLFWSGELEAPPVPVTVPRRRPQRP